jgi:MFS family permease
VVTGDVDRASPSNRAPLIALFAASLVFTLGDGSVQLLLGPFLQERGIPPTGIGPIVAGYSVASLVARLLTGFFYRPELVRFLVPAGCLLQAASFLALASTSSVVLYAVAVATNGFGFAVASTGGLAAVMELRPRTNAGSLMGWYTGFIGAGYALANVVGGIAGDTLGLTRAVTTLALLPVLAAAGLAFALRSIGAISAGSDSKRREGGFRLSVFRNVSPLVWLAFMCALHINLLSGVLLTFFPLFALSIGLTLTQVGALTGLSSGVSSIFRFLSPALFSRVSYRPFIPWMVIVGGLATAALALSQAYVALAVFWVAIGLSRAVLRVSSAALVMDSATEGQDRGAASGVYLSGLDIGKMIGPVLGGFTVSSLGFEATFLIAGLSVPFVFFTYFLRVRSRRGAELSGS